MFSRASRNVTRAQTLGNASIAIPVVVVLLGGFLLNNNDDEGTRPAMAFVLFGVVVLGIVCAIVAMLLASKGDRVGVIVRGVIGLALGSFIVAGVVSAFAGT